MTIIGVFSTYFAFRQNFTDKVVMYAKSCVAGSYCSLLTALTINTDQ